MCNKTLSEEKKNQWLSNLDNGFVSIDSSSFSSLSCDRKALLSWVMKFSPSYGRAPLIFGHMLHELLEWQLKTGEIELTSFKKKALEIIDQEGENLNNCLDDRRNTEVFLSLIESYAFNLKAKGDRIKPLKLNNEPLVEKSFSLPLGDFNLEGKKITILWEGKIDAIALDTHSNEICIVDHKTTSILGDKFLDDKQRGVQFHGYLFAANEFQITEKKIETVMLNVICSRKTGFEFQIMKFKRPYSQVQEWRKDTESIVEQKVKSLFYHITKQSHLSSDRNHCCSKYGKCEFFQVCEAPVNSRQSFLYEPSFYQISNWSPLI